MFEAIGVRLAESALMQSPIGGFIRGAWALARKIPWQVWAVLALALVAFIGVKVHHSRVTHFAKVEYHLGYEAGFAAAKAQAEQARTAVETKGRTMAQDVRSKNDAKTADLDAAVHTVFVRGPGRAACAPISPAAADGSPQPGGPEGHDAVSGVPAGEGQPLIGVPIDAAAAFARQNDKALIDNASWWDWYDRYSAIIAGYQKQVADLTAKQEKTASEDAWR